MILQYPHLAFTRPQIICSHRSTTEIELVPHGRKIDVRMTREVALPELHEI